MAEGDTDIGKTPGKPRGKRNKGRVESLSYYLKGTSFVVQTDHNPLVWLNRMKDKNQRLLRWALALQPYQITVQYRKGQLNKNADGLSRC